MGSYAPRSSERRRTPPTTPLRTSACAIVPDAAPVRLVAATPGSVAQSDAARETDQPSPTSASRVHGLQTDFWRIEGG